MLGQRLKVLRTSRGKTQQEIASLLSISRSAYTLYESEKRQLSYEALLLLADLYGVSLDYLFGRTEVQTSQQALTGEERALLEQYRAMDSRGRETVRGVAELEFRRK